MRLSRKINEHASCLFGVSHPASAADADDPVPPSGFAAESGFIPGVDHRVPADVSLENYKYYLKLKRDMFDAGGIPQYNESGV